MKMVILVPLIVLTLVIVALLTLTTSSAALAGYVPPTCTVPTGQPVIAAESAPPATQPASGSAYGGVNLSPAQMTVAQAILGTAKGMGITQRGAVISIQVAMQESTLNADAQAGQSIGAFQQIAPGPYRAYAGYDPRDPAAAAKGFFTVLLKRDPGYDTDPLPNEQIGQLVQASGAGASKYAKWQSFATALVSALYTGNASTITCTSQSVTGKISVSVQGNVVTLPPQAGVPGTVSAPSPQIAKVIASALSWLGETYSWGGGNANGPTPGKPGDPEDPDYQQVGFDCSGLTLYSYAQVGVSLPHSSGAQLSGARMTVPFGQAQPGDLLFWGQAVHHVAIFLGVIDGKPRIVQAPQAGVPVDVAVVDTGGDFRDVAARPLSASTT
jgi:cell wall-associated NlpC family hydrolase